jgi:hypothetical protein
MDPHRTAALALLRVEVADVLDVGIVELTRRVEALV